MAEVDINNLSPEELELYEKQLSIELSKVQNRIKQVKKVKMHPDLIGPRFRKED